MLKVLQLGFYASIQDQGRESNLRDGVPISGIMDAFSANLANRILNNSKQSALLEIMVGKSAFQFLEATIICITGADFSPTLNGKSISLNKKYKVFINDILEFGKPKYGAKAYLSVKGGFLTPIVLDSRSFYKGITNETQIKKADIIPFKPIEKKIQLGNSAVKVDFSHFHGEFLESYKGPEFDLLNDEQIHLLFSRKYTVSKDINRMGYRLEEPLHNTLPQILTSSTLPGTVQLTPAGKLIVMMRDAQVTGGYPRVLQLSELAISRLSQKNAGEKIHFRLKKY